MGELAQYEEIAFWTGDYAVWVSKASKSDPYQGAIQRKRLNREEKRFSSMHKKNSLIHVYESMMAEHHTTIAEIRREMEKAIRVGLNHPDPKVQAQWAKIPRKGDIPTPDELIMYVARQAKKWWRRNDWPLPFLNFPLSFEAAR